MFPIENGILWLIRILLLPFSLQQLEIAALIVNEADICNISTVSSSVMYDVGTSYGPSPAQSTEPLKLFKGEIVIFKGLHEGGSTTMYEFLVGCDVNINITGIFMASAAHYSDTLYLLDSNQNIIWSYGLSGGNNYVEWHWTDITNAFGTTFYLKETNSDFTWRWRQNITIYASVDSETPTKQPSVFPTHMPTAPTSNPTFMPSKQPTKHPSVVPTSLPSNHPSIIPSQVPSTHRSFSSPIC